MSARIRIESTGNVVRDAKVIYLPDEGPEVDISRCITGVNLSLHVGDVARATLHAIFVEGRTIEAEVEDAIITRLRRRRRFHRLRRLDDRLAWWAKRRLARALGPELRRELLRIDQGGKQ